MTADRIDNSSTDSYLDKYISVISSFVKITGEIPIEEREAYLKKFSDEIKRFYKKDASFIKAISNGNSEFLIEEYFGFLKRKFQPKPYYPRAYNEPTPRGVLIEHLYLPPISYIDILNLQDKEFISKCYQLIAQKLDDYHTKGSINSSNYVMQQKFYFACALNQMDKVKEIIDTIDTSTIKEALNIAIEYGHLEVVKTLINKIGIDRLRFSFLLEDSAQHRNYEVFEFLCAQSAGEIKYEWHIRHHVKTLFEEVNQGGNIDIIKYLHNNYTQEWKDSLDLESYSFNLFSNAIKSCNLAVIDYYIDEHNFSLNDVETDTLVTLLQKAITTKNPTLLGYLHKISKEKLYEIIRANYSIYIDGFDLSVLQSLDHNNFEITSLLFKTPIENSDEICDYSVKLTEVLNRLSCHKVFHVGFPDAKKNFENLIKMAEIVENKGIKTDIFPLYDALMNEDIDRTVAIFKEEEVSIDILQTLPHKDKIPHYTRLSNYLHLENKNFKEPNEEESLEFIKESNEEESLEFIKEPNEKESLEFIYDELMKYSRAESHNRLQARFMRFCHFQWGNNYGDLVTQAFIARNEVGKTEKFMNEENMKEFFNKLREIFYKNGKDPTPSNPNGSLATILKCAKNTWNIDFASLANDDTHKADAHEEPMVSSSLAT